jgi:hypothetical protein
MKAIKLTEEHKSKLLEMCNKLFPEYGDVQLLKSYCATEYDATGSPYLRWYIPFEHNGKKTTKLIKIHWFEFCMTHLVEKLIEVINEYESKLSDSKREKFFIEIFEPYELLMSIKDKHPIDYLYEEFKKLK